MGEEMYGLAMMYTNPYQARVPTMEEAVKQLTPLTSTGPDWPTPWCSLTEMPAMDHSLQRSTRASIVQGKH